MLDGHNGFGIADIPTGNHGEGLLQGYFHELDDLILILRTGIFHFNQLVCQVETKPLIAKTDGRVKIM